MKILWVVGGLAAVGVVGMAVWKARSAPSSGTSLAGQVGGAVGGAVVDAADGVVSGVVKGIGSIVGVPDTNETECEKAIREGRSWDASFACPAGTFIGSLWDSWTKPAEPPVDQTIMDPRDAWARAGGTGGSGASSNSRTFTDISTPGAYWDPLTGTNYGT